MPEEEWRGNRILDISMVAVGVVMVIYQMVAAHLSVFDTYAHQTVHLGFLFTLVFLGACKRARNHWDRALMLSLVALGLASTVYVFIYLEHLELAVGFPDQIDVVVGVVLVALVMEGTRRAWGWILPIVAITSILYFLFGQWLPGPLYHREFDFSYIISYLSIGLTGVYGNFLSLSANQIFLFIVFGAFMGLMRMSDFLYEIGKLAGRGLRGGPGQSAVVASSLMGMVTGASVANVAITGAFTIPYMKRMGYSGSTAGAIEATASTGSQFMPPVMGAGAFLMAFFVGVPYVDIMVAALIPALLFYFAVALGIQFASVAAGIDPPPEKIDKRAVVQGLPMFVIPVAVISVLLLMRYSPGHAAFWAILTALGLSMLRPAGPPRIAEVVKHMVQGATVGAQIGISLCAVGVIAQTLISTGLGSKVAGLVELLSDGNMFIGLILTMFVTLILGCGVPTVAAYSLVAIVVAPTLIHMGIPILAAHFFVFYFAVIAAVTPPVGLAALAAAGIAEASFLKTGFSAFKLSIAGFIIPYLMIFNPVLNFDPIGIVSATASMIAIIFGIFALTSAIYGVVLTRITSMHRGLMLCASVLLLGYALIRHNVPTMIDLTMFVGGAACLLWVGFRQFQQRGERLPMTS